MTTISSARRCRPRAADLDFWKVKIKPGKPLLFGTLGRALVLGLPGNPVSAQLNFTLFGLPLLRAMQGEPTRGPRLHALDSRVTSLKSRAGSACIARDSTATRWCPRANQASGSVAEPRLADALVLVPAESEGYQAGSMVDIIRLSPS